MRRQRKIENGKTLRVEEDFRVPGTNVILEAGDRIRVLYEATGRQYAVIQIGYGIFGVGRTPEDAIADARRFTDGPINPVDLRNVVDGDMVVIPCTEELARAVQREGSDVEFLITNGVAELE